MPRRLASSNSNLHPIDVSRALHLDFEGFRNAPPCLAGVQVDGDWTGTVFADVVPSLVPAAREKGLAISTLDDFLAGLFERAVGEHRRIAGFSTREREVFRDRDVAADEIGDHYLNTLELARSWRKRHHPEAARRIADRRRRARVRGSFVDRRGNRLVDFARLAELPSCRSYGVGCTTGRLRHVIGQLESRRAYRHLTPTAKGKWTRLLEHNRWDCRASASIAALALAEDRSVR